MMGLSSAAIVALLLLACMPCLSSVEAKATTADIDTKHKIRRRVVEVDKNDKTKDKNKKEEAPKCISVIGQPCNPDVAGMSCCLDSSKAHFLQCDDKKSLCEQMKDKDVENFIAAEAGAGGAEYEVAQAPEQNNDDKKNSKQKQPACVETIGGWCDDVTMRCCLNTSKNQFLRCKNNYCERMKEKDVEKMIGAATDYGYTATSTGGCRSDKDCCDEDKECDELRGECVKPSCPKQCFRNDDCKPCNKDCIEGKCSSRSCPAFCSKDSECRDCNKICQNNKCEKPKCPDVCVHDKDCRACGEFCNKTKFECEKPKCPDVCVHDDQCKPCGKECVNGRCERDCVA